MPTCPICKLKAEEIEPSFFDGKTFFCPRHKQFQVADSVFSTKKCMDADANQWERALKQATDRAKPGERPRILTYDF
jgi:hypothetical protein